MESKDFSGFSLDPWKTLTSSRNPWIMESSRIINRQLVFVGLLHVLHNKVLLNMYVYWTNEMDVL